MADTSDATIAVIAETTAGTTPTGTGQPAFKLLRMTGETLTANYETLVSNEIRADGIVGNVRRMALSTAGEINFELHRDAALDQMLEAALRSTFTTGVLKGGLLKPSFTLERKAIGSAETGYFRFTGSRIGGLSLSFSPDEIITGSLRVTGQGHSVGNAILTGATYAAATTNAPMAGIDVTSLAVSGVTGVDYTNLTIELDSNLRIQRKLGATDSRGIGYGRRQVTGTLTCYFESLAAYNAFLTDAQPSITATAGDGTNSYTITVPKIRITGGEVPIPGNDQDIMVTLNWQAIYDSASATDIQISRSPA